MTAAEALPQPQAVSLVAFADVVTRSVTVRLPDTASGYERMLWNAGWQALRRAQEAGWPASGAPWVWCDTPSARQVVHGQPGEAATLVFSFPVGVAGFAELVGRPGLIGIGTVDRSSHLILSVKLLNRAR